MKMLKNNRGLTLLELIVSFALLGLVSAAVLGLMTTGANSYHRVNTEVSLQYEAQLSMNQLHEYLVDSNAGIFWDADGQAFYIADRADVDDGEGHLSTVTTVHRFRFAEEDGTLQYSSGEVTLSGATGACALGTEYLMSSYISGLDVEVRSSYNGFGQRLCDSCLIELTLELGSRTYTVSEVVSMRNPVLTLNDYQGWLNLLANNA